MILALKLISSFYSPKLSTDQLTALHFVEQDSYAIFNIINNKKVIDMNILLKIIRWIIVIFAVMSILGFLMGRTLGRPWNNGTQTDFYVALGWGVIGGIALYFEIKSTKKNKLSR